MISFDFTDSPLAATALRLLRSPVLRPRSARTPRTPTAMTRPPRKRSPRVKVKKLASLYLTRRTMMRSRWQSRSASWRAMMREKCFSGGSCHSKFMCAGIAMRRAVAHDFILWQHCLQSLASGTHMEGMSLMALAQSTSP